MDNVEKVIINRGCDPSNDFEMGGCREGFDYAANLVSKLNAMDTVESRNTMKGMTNGIPMSTRTLIDANITTNNNAFANSVGYDVYPSGFDTLNRVAINNTPGISYYTTQACNSCDDKDDCNCASNSKDYVKNKTGASMETSSIILIIVILVIIYLCWDKIKKIFKM